jgi:SRSO17 transposase
MLDGAKSHDQITRFLSKEDFDQKMLWKLVKPSIRRFETDNGVLVVDDTIVEKEYTDENDLIAWHYDHSKGRSIKGINVVNLIYHTEDDMNIPVSFRVVEKSEEYIDEKTGNKKRRSKVNKNEYFRDMLMIATKANQILYKYVLSDIWFSSEENMKYIKMDLKKDFVMPVKSNRLVALSYEDKINGKFVNIESIDFKLDTEIGLYIKGVNFPVNGVKQVFTNKDGSQGVLYIVTSDTSLRGEEMEDIYNKRWNIEPHYKSLKNNLGIGMSPTKTKRTQSNHVFLSVYAYLKMEIMRSRTKLNHFALKSKLYLKAIQTSYLELQKVKAEFAIA